MKLARLSAELQHVAEHGHASSRLRAENVERGSNRGRVGVVAFVNEKQGSGGQRDGLANPASGRRAHLAECHDGARQVDIRGDRGTERRQSVHRHVLAAQPYARLVLCAAELEGDHRAGPGRLDVAEAQAGIRMMAEGHDPCRSERFGLRTKKVEERIVAIENRRAAGLQPLEDFGLCVGNVRDAVEELDMDGLDGGHDGDVRPDHRCQRTDFTGMIHADLAYREVRVGRHPRQRQRHPPMVVEGGVGRMDLAGRGEDRAEHLLRASLADAAGHPDDHGIRARPGGSCQFAQGFEDVSDDELAPAVADEPRDHGAGRAGVERGLHEIVPVEAIPSDGEEGVAGREGPTVDGDAGDVAHAATGIAGHRGLEIGDGPQGRVRHSLDAPARSATAARTTS